MRAEKSGSLSARICADICRVLISPLVGVLQKGPHSIVSIKAFLFDFFAMKDVF